MAGRPGTGTTVREYVWLDDMPLAVVADVDTMSPQLYYVHADHLNRPIMMTDASKATVWEAHYWPYGEAYAITGSASLNLRFPGQYFLLEHGLAYNWHRYYDPTIGRYTRPDPLVENQLIAGQRAIGEQDDATVPGRTERVCVCKVGADTACRSGWAHPSGHCSTNCVVLAVSSVVCSNHQSRS